MEVELDMKWMEAPSQSCCQQHTSAHVEVRCGMKRMEAPKRLGIRSAIMVLNKAPRYIGFRASIMCMLALEH
jgi:hypothetical protein